MIDHGHHHVEFELAGLRGRGNRQVVAEHLSEANLVGHDSHGFHRLIQYVSQIQKGIIVPDARPEIVSETPSTAQIDGHRCFGQVVAKMGAEVAIEKASERDVSCVAIRNVGHVGRLGAYTAMAARAGMAALALTGAGGNVHIVAPFGGRKGRMATNPISMSFPSDQDGDILLDFATSMVPEGKLRVAQAKGESIPDNWIYDKDGNPSTNPADFYDGGALRPFGDHKGYCLAFMTEVLAGILTGDGYGHEERSDFSVGSFDSNGTLIVVIKVQTFLRLETARAQAGELASFMKETPLAPGFDRILYPGEWEASCAAQRNRDGILIPESTWDQVKTLINGYGLNEKLGPLA